MCNSTVSHAFSISLILLKCWCIAKVVISSITYCYNTEFSSISTLAFPNHVFRLAHQCHCYPSLATYSWSKMQYCQFQAVQAFAKILWSFIRQCCLSRASSMQRWSLCDVLPCLCQFEAGYDVTVVFP